MKKIVIIVSILTLIVSGCGRTIKKQLENGDNLVSQTENAEQSIKNQEIYAQLIKAIETDDHNFFDKSIKEISVIDTLIKVDENEYSLLGYACKYKRCDFAEKLINSKANIEIGESDEYLVYDALSVAVQSQDLCVVKLLLDKGANPNRMNSEEGFTVLSLSCRLNNYDITKLLIEKGAQVDGLGYTEGTDYVHYPLLYAVESNNIKLVQLLIDNNCKIDIKDKQGETPFTIAERNENQQIHDVLKEKLQKIK